ncbi:MAG: DUF1460 domain-containing protein [Bacteroidia bacterium]|nr:DUF1460 domain-containing protein [Bacteroidia bacterium]
MNRLWYVLPFFWLQGERPPSSSHAVFRVDTPYHESFTLPPYRVVGRTPSRIQEALTVHVGREYADWARSVASAWQGIPYGSGGAGLGPQEILLNLEQMDCMTAVENLLALHLTYKMGSSGVEGMTRALARVRYATPLPCRWEDRYHYFTHALLAWELEGWGACLPLGVRDKRPIRYISSHPERYRGFRDWEAIRSIEKTLSVKPRYYIPSPEMGEWLFALRDGDIIAFVSSEEGLDVSHVGVFFWEGSQATFSHASLKERKWVWGEDLCAYLDRRRGKVMGITVFRPYP